MIRKTLVTKLHLEIVRFSCDARHLRSPSKNTCNMHEGWERESRAVTRTTLVNSRPGF